MALRDAELAREKELVLLDARNMYETSIGRFSVVRSCHDLAAKTACCQCMILGTNPRIKEL